LTQSAHYVLAARQKSWLVQRPEHPAAPILIPMFSKTDYAYEALRRNILDGTLKPGERLRLSPIAKALDLSEMPVREALRQLQRDGLVVMHLHRGAEVAQLSLKHAFEIEEVRLQLEAHACLSAAPFHDSMSIKRLRTILSEMRADSSNAVALARLNRNFHTELMSRAPNAFLRDHVQELWDRCWQFSSASFFDFMPRRMAALPVEGKIIVQHLKTQDLDQLAEFLQARAREVTAAWHEAAEAYAHRAERERVHG
jgi:DNA-binding GntR family transcriptional regulator